MSNRTAQVYHRFHQHKLIVTLVSLLVIALIVVNVVMAAELSHLGIHLQEIANQTEKLNLENQQLSQQIHQSGSLHDLQAKAESEGFSVTSTYQHFDNLQPVALEF